MKLAQKSVAAGTCGQSQQCLWLGDCALIKTWKETESMVPTAWVGEWPRCFLDIQRPLQASSGTSAGRTRTGCINSLLTQPKTALST